MRKWLLAILLFALVPQDAVQQARKSFDSGDYAKATQILSSALAAKPQDSAINFWLGRSYYELRDYDKAISYGEAAVKLAPDNSEYVRWLGRAYGGKADQSHSFLLARKVKESFETAVRLAPNSIEARRDLMEYLAEAPWIVGGSQSQAKEEVDAIAKLDPLQGRLAQAALLAADKKWKEAVTEYRAVLAADPSRLEPYMEAAEFFAGRNDPVDLQYAVDGAGRVNARDPRINYYRAVILVLQHQDTAKAESLLKSYIASVPPRSDFPSHEDATAWLRRIGI